jgi:hypothetical protein
MDSHTVSRIVDRRRRFGLRQQVEQTPERLCRVQRELVPIEQSFEFAVTMGSATPARMS